MLTEPTVNGSHGAMSPEPAAEHHDTRPRIESLLFGAGLITADQLGELAHEHATTGLPMAEIALGRGLVDPETLQRLLGGAAPAAPAPAEVQAHGLDAPPVEAVAPFEDGGGVVLPLTAPTFPAPVPAPPVEEAPPAPPAQEPSVPEPSVPEPVLAAVPAVPAPSAPVVPEPVPVEPVAVEPVAFAPLAPVAPAPEAMMPAPLPAPIPVPVPLPEPSPLAPAPEAVVPTVASVPRHGIGYAVTARLSSGHALAVGCYSDETTAFEVSRGLLADLTSGREWLQIGATFVRPGEVISLEVGARLASDSD